MIVQTCQVSPGMHNSVCQVKSPYSVKPPIYCESRELPVDSLLETLKSTYMFLG
jgi:hypothetical protein